MTPEIEKKRREVFEAWLDQDGLDFQFDESRNCYKNFTCHMAWRAFNAALDAVEIVFPNQRDEKYQECYDDVEGGCFNYILYLKDVRNAITATGLGLRIK